MGVTSEMEEQELVRPFQVYVRCHSPRQNLLNVESIKPCITRFISRRIQTAAQTEDWKPHFIGSIGFFSVLSSLPFLKVIALPFLLQYVVCLWRGVMETDPDTCCLSIHHASRLFPSTDKCRRRLNLNTGNHFFFTNTSTFFRGFYR